VIAHPRATIGSDGLPHDRHPHPRLWGAFPRVFARDWRERPLFTLEQAVHKMTGLTARQFRIPDRGLLRAGQHADVVVFDPQRIADRATFAEPLQPSAGIVAVYVNGVPSFAEGQPGTPPSRAGRMLTRGLRYP
jgi:N-acyl-D-amino-acid deacylase